MKKITFLLLVLITYKLAARAQVYTRTDLGIKAKINSTQVEVQFFGPSTVKIINSPYGKSFNKQSLSVIKKPDAGKINIVQSGNFVSMRNEKLNVQLNMKSGRLSFATIAGSPLHSFQVE
jgi:alpha-D-xyloside xylohydrolase